VKLLCILQAEAESKEADELRTKLSKTENSSLSALILRNQQSRSKQMDTFFADLATKYGGQEKSRRSTSRTRTVSKSAAGKSSKRTVSKSKSQSKAKK